MFEVPTDPKFVITAGAFSLSGGPYINRAEVTNGAGSVVLIDLVVPGCPPYPMIILDGLLRLLKKIETAEGRSR